MRKLIYVFTAAFLSQSALAKITIVTPADSGKTFPLSIGQCVDVRLSSNAASTGYQWYLAPGMSEVLSLAARTVTAPAEPMPGAPSTLDYTICAAKPGQAMVRFSNYRIWEKNAKPAQAFAFTVKVRASSP